MELLIKVKELVEHFEQEKEKLVKQLEEGFPKVLKPLFDKHESIESIGWTQYTPHWNDGDTCTFYTNMYPDSLYVNGEYAGDMSNKEWEKFENIAEEFSDTLTQIPDEFYLEMFGDHAMVTVNRDGTVEVDGYSHD